MTIQDPVKFCAGLWDWAILDGCFGETRIRPTDVDGFIERHEKFLLLETKAPGASIPEGQMRTFDALVKLKVFTVMVIWGTNGSPEEIQVITRWARHDKKRCDISELRKLVSKWFEYADGF